MSAWEVCPSCKGCGLQDGMYGPVCCYECGGDCMVRVRDSRGRFAAGASGPVTTPSGISESPIEEPT